MKPLDGDQAWRFQETQGSREAQDGMGQAVEVHTGQARIKAAALVQARQPSETGVEPYGMVIVGGAKEARGIGTAPSRGTLRRLAEAFGSYSSFIYQFHDLARSTRQWVSLYVDPETDRLRMDAAPSPAPTAVLAMDARPLAHIGPRQMAPWLWAHTQVIDWALVAERLETGVATAPETGHNYGNDQVAERRPPMSRIFDPANKDRLLDPSRREWNHPDKILAYLNLGEHTNFVEIGAGNGWFSIPAARLIGVQGKVYAADISEEMLAALKENAEKEGVADRVELVLATDDDEYPIATGVADAVLLANVYHEVDPATNFLHELRRITKPGGLLLVVDWRPEETPVGPPLAERLNPQDVTEEFTQAGFVLAGTVEVGPYHYGLKFYLPMDINAEKPTQNNRVP
jgi:SAM-dependent methyltransferase